VEHGREPRAIEVHYDRKDSAICHVRRQDVPWDALKAARIFFVSGITPALAPATRELCLEMAAAARAAGVTVVTDLNFRSRLWSAAEAGPVLERLAQSAHIVIATEDDLATLYGFTGERDAVARQAAERFGAATFVLTCGRHGAVSVVGGSVRRCGVFPASGIDRIGAGDAFTAGFLYATLLERHERALDYGLALAALKHSIPGDTVVTTPAEVERILERGVKDIRR
jgi:2-dehydro-3-deoxygluconokinase